MGPAVPAHAVCCCRRSLLLELRNTIKFGVARRNVNAEAEKLISKKTEWNVWNDSAETSHLNRA